MISWGGYCGPCGKAVLVANVDSLHERNGEPWQRWRFGMTRRALGDEIANALFSAGVFDTPMDAAADAA